MVERKKDSEIKVNDRRLFTSDGELRTETTEEVAIPAVEVSAPAPVATSPVVTVPTTPAEPVASDVPPLPSASEQKAQHDAYQQSARELDARVEQSGHSAKELQVSFERFMASLYMTAMMQLGLMVEQGGSPQVDIIGARQTIDTLSMMSDKTKGNLNAKEQAFMQNALYELRMAYVEVTNALAHPPSPITGTNG
ncbi:MAG: DUF1844 domain-containing protein [Acidobacteria bacterium]|nr:DUF1844 domain-containing protein [Acidobacteriota bacterium]